jgi:hypothetical protein
MNQIVLPETGATLKPGPMLTVVPGRSISDDQLAHVGQGTGLNGPFLADQLSAWITHQRMGRNLLRTLEARTSNPVLQGMYVALLASTDKAVQAWERLSGQLGSNPQYASPPARMQEGMDTKVVEALLLPGSADPLSFETAGLMAAYSAMTLSVLHAELLTGLAEVADDSEAKRAMTAAAGELTQHAYTGLAQVATAIEKTTSLQAEHPVGQKLMQGMERATAKLRDTLR